MAEIDIHDFKIIENICIKGDLLFSEGCYQEAINEYLLAYSLIPEPQVEHSATTWILTALGDVYFLNKNYSEAFRAFAYAVNCPEGLGNPFIHLRLGQLNFERGNFNNALDELLRAYMGAGCEVFENEDSKYFEYLKSQVKPPTSGTW